MHINRQQKKILQFPFVCNYRIITLGGPDNEAKVKEVLQDFPTVNNLRRSNVSAMGTYISYQVDISLESREMMERLDQGLRAIAGVKAVL